MWLELSCTLTHAATKSKLMRQSNMIDVVLIFFGISCCFGESVIM